MYPYEAIPLINPTDADVTVTAEIASDNLRNYLHVMERGWVIESRDSDGDGSQDQCVDGDYFERVGGVDDYTRARIPNFVVPAYSSRILIVSWYWANQEPTDYTLTVTR